MKLLPQNRIAYQAGAHRLVVELERPKTLYVSSIQTWTDPKAEISPADKQIVVARFDHFFDFLGKPYVVTGS